MRFFKTFFSSIFKKPSLYLFIFLIFFSVDRYNRWVNFDKEAPFVYDVGQYYAYLPAVFIHHDLNFPSSDKYWTTKAINGNNIPKYTYGLAVMYSPFFLIGHVIAKNTNYVADGYSQPYKWSIHFGSILFSLLGLWFCRKNLLVFFNEFVTVVTLIAIYFGTNLFYYTYGLGEMPHDYLFFIFSVFIYFVLKWYRSKKYKDLLIFSLLAGFATLIRPTEFVILMFPFLIGVKNITDLKERIALFISYRLKLIPVAILFILPFFLQMVYWKIYAGSWLFFSYGKEGFFFSDPQIINFLFSFRKGWLIYTPIMAFSIIGLVILKKRAANLFLFSILYFFINIYVLSCWWDWSFGGSFGCRPLIQHYAFFALPFASFISWYFTILKTKKILSILAQILLLTVFYFLIDLNLFQSWQYKYGIIPSEGLNKEAYFYLLSKKKFTHADSLELDKINKTTFSYEDMIKGNRD